MSKFCLAELLPGRKLYYVAADIGTNPTASGLTRKKSSLAARAIRAMTKMRDNGTIAFIGPDDTCSSEALVAAAWNLPMISYVCTFNVFIFTQSTRFNGSSNLRDVMIKAVAMFN